MELWRVSNYDDLSGVGGMRASGRWHTRGRRIVYLADHPASALLEMLVRIDLGLIPQSYTLLRVAVPDILIIPDIDAEQLPAGWRQEFATTRRLGDDWLDQNQSALLEVPSAIVPRAWNYLFSPAHPQAAYVHILEVIHAPFDPRLVRTR